jgi:hypothetical protein
MSDQLNDFINRQHERDLLAEQRWTRVETLLEQNSERLFGGPNQKGALVFLHEEHAKVTEDLGKVAGRVGKLESWKLGTTKWVAGALAVLTLEGTALAFVFNHVASVIKAAQAVKGH